MNTETDPLTPTFQGEPFHDTYRQLAVDAINDDEETANAVGGPFHASAISRVSKWRRRLDDLDMHNCSEPAPLPRLVMAEGPAFNCGLTAMNTAMTMTRTRTVALQKTIIYRVYLETAKETACEIVFAPPSDTCRQPTKYLIEQILSMQEESLPRPESSFAKEDYDKDMARLENLIALMRLVPVLHMPTVGKTETHNVTAAGIYIGKVVVKATEAWTTV